MGFLRVLSLNKKETSGVSFVSASSSRLAGYDKTYTSCVSYFAVSNSDQLCVYNWLRNPKALSRKRNQQNYILTALTDDSDMKQFRECSRDTPPEFISQHLDISLGVYVDTYPDCPTLASDALCTCGACLMYSCCQELRHLAGP